MLTSPKPNQQSLPSCPSLLLFKRNQARYELQQFLSLSELKTPLPDDILQIYCAHLNELQRDMSHHVLRSFVFCFLFIMPI